MVIDEETPHSPEGDVVHTEPFSRSDWEWLLDERREGQEAVIPQNPFPSLSPAYQHNTTSLNLACTCLLLIFLVTCLILSLSIYDLFFLR